MTVDLTTLTQRMDELKDAEARLKFELKQVEKEQEKIQLQLEEALRQVGADTLTFGVYQFGWEEKTTNRLNQKMLKEKYKDIFNECYLPTVSRKFNFYINK